MDGHKSFHGRPDKHGCSRNRQSFYEHGFSNAHKNKDERVSTSRPQGISNESLWPTCASCGKRYEGRCLSSRLGYFSCIGVST